MYIAFQLITRVMHFDRHNGKRFVGITLIKDYLQNVFFIVQLYIPMLFVVGNIELGCTETTRTARSSEGSSELF